MAKGFTAVKVVQDLQCASLVACVIAFVQTIGDDIQIRVAVLRARIVAAPSDTAALRSAILADKSNDAKSGSRVYGFTGGDDLYRAFLHEPQYHWGSNNPRAQYGNTNLDVITYGLDKSITQATRLAHWRSCTTFTA